MAIMGGSQQYFCFSEGEGVCFNVFVLTLGEWLLDFSSHFSSIYLSYQVLIQ